MITVKKVIFNKEFKEIDILNGIAFIEVIEDDILSKIKLDLTDEGYKFTRIINTGTNKAIIYKEGVTSLPWVLEKYFTGVYEGNVITEEEFETYKSETIKTI